MTLKPRTLILAGFAAAVVAGLLWVSFRPEPVAVDLHEVARGPMQITIDADGKTRIRDVYDVVAPIAGTTRRSPVSVGDAVIKDQTVLAVVEPVAPTLLDTRTRIQAEAAVREAEASLHVAESELRQAEEDLAYQKSQYERVKTLVERGVSSVTQLEDATQELAITTAAHAAATSRLDLARGSLERAEAALIEPTASGSDDSGAACCVELRAPIDGRVLSIDVVSESPVGAGTLLLSIGQPQELEIVSDILSSEAVRIAPGNRAIVERWGGPDPLEAVVRSVEPSANTKVSALGIEEQRVDVVFDLLSPPEDRPALGDGYAVYLRVVEWEGEDVLQVPLSALFRQGQAWAVYVAEGDTARLTEVTLGHRNGRMAEILGGLEPGVQVITHPSDAVADGVLIADRGAL